MTAVLWEQMVADAKTRVQPEDTLVSGGAAWADHLAVRLYLDGSVKHLILHLPAPFVDGQFQGERESAASAANYYHHLFSTVLDVDTRQEVADAIAKGAKVTEQPIARGYGAMFARNALVAKVSKAVIAYTFGDGDEPADGGTKDTWGQVKGDRIHVPLAPMTAPRSPMPAMPAMPAPHLASPQRPAAAGPQRASPPASAMARLDLLGNRNRRASRP